MGSFSKNVDACLFFIVVEGCVVHNYKAIIYTGLNFLRKC